MSEAAPSVAARSFEGAPTVGLELPAPVPQEQSQASSGAASSEAPQEKPQASSGSASSEAPQEEPRPLPASTPSPASPPGSASRPRCQVNASSTFPFSIDAHQVGACIGKVHWAWAGQLRFQASPDEESHAAASCPGVDLELQGIDARCLGPCEGDTVLTWDFNWSEEASSSAWAALVSLPRATSSSRRRLAKDWGLGSAWGMGYEQQDIS